jgi:hypothetical protein
LSSSSGKLAKVAYAQNEMEAEMIRGLLSEHGIPSISKHPTGGTPYSLFTNHQIFVPEEVAERAREVLEGMPGAGP